ncbi:hypothetical protein P4O66_004051 [Electrophorus voltai]|uniref:Uncharacterized protein n=1 Tax=Electrophorus voltai TaxID=2609070 RepID=A0AAD9E5T7_9TELE|nr:hypothetical protein P4O66_004051 [Electrophorus voltai]
MLQRTQPRSWNTDTFPSSVYTLPPPHFPFKPKPASHVVILVLCCNKRVIVLYTTRPASCSASCSARYRNIDRQRMLGKKYKKKTGKKERNRSSRDLMGKPSTLLDTLGVDSAESYRPLTDYKNRYKGDQYPGPDSAGSYDPYWDYRESYGEYEQSEGYTEVSLRWEFTDVSF